MTLPSLNSTYDFRKRANPSEIARAHPIKKRKILPADATPSETEAVTGVSQEASIRRIDQTVTNFFVDATVCKELSVKIKRVSTEAQGASARNANETPSRKRHARHLDPASSVRFQGSPERLGAHIETVGKITPTTGRTLKALCDTPTRAALNQSPTRSREILKCAFKKSIDLYKATHYGNTKHTTIESLATSNQFDRMVEFRIRCYWDTLMERADQKKIPPHELTLEYVEKLKTILDTLKTKADMLTPQLEQFFALEEQIFIMDRDGKTDPQTYVDALRALLQLKQTIVSNFSTIELINSIKLRRTDWYWINRITKKNELEPYENSLRIPDHTDPEYQNQKTRLLKVAADIKLEATYQHTAIHKIDQQVIEEMQTLLFGDRTKENVFQLLGVDPFD